MFFQYRNDGESYRIGKATIDSSFHTQSADESFFAYFCNDTLYSVTRTIHPEDLETFRSAVSTLEDDEVRHTIIRMKNSSGEYRPMIVKMAVNRSLPSHDEKYTDIVVKDAVLLEKSTTKLENIIKHFRFLMSMPEAIIFEYSSETNKLYIYSFDYNASTVFFNEDFDYFKFHVTSENMVASGSLETFESFFESVKSGISRFSFELETSILTGGEQQQQQIFSGFTVSDGEKNRLVLGLITAKNQKENISGADIVFETNLDSLTKLFNKKAISRYAVGRMESKGVDSVTIVIIDIDDFKYINDRYGHLFGDEILCTAAAVLKQETGSKGAAGRIGGDEFMLVLDDIKDEMELRSILRAVRSNINVMCAEKAEGLHITCSMGTAAYPENASSYSQLFKTADKALYIAKEKGKDRYVIYNSEKHGPVEETQTAIEIGLAERRNRMNKADTVGDIIMDLLVSRKMTLYETLELTGKTFELDRIDIFLENDMKRVFSWPSADEGIQDAGYIFEDNYAENFAGGNVFVMDNTDILEDRNPKAFYRLKEAGINASVQFISSDDENISGMIAFELIGHYKKWPQMDVNYMTILGRIILEELINGGDMIG